MLGSLLTDYLPVRPISGNSTITAFSKFIEVDCSSGNITLTLSGSFFPKYQNMTIKRIDDTLNTLTINGANYEDDGIILFGLEGATIYFSNDNTWKSVL